MQTAPHINEKYRYNYEKMIIRGSEMIGKKLYYLKIISFFSKVHKIKDKGKEEYRNRNVLYFKCLCNCGNKTTIVSYQFGRTKSCGCLQIKSAKSRVGGKSANAKYSDSEVTAMKELFLSAAYSEQEICEMFSICKRLFREIINGKSWTHIKIDEKLIDKNILEFLKSRKVFNRLNHEYFIGKKFGDREITGFFKSEKKCEYHFTYKCKCGHTSSAIVDTFFKTKACQKCKSAQFAQKRNLLIGKKFGNQTIISIESKNKILYGIVKCDCGYERYSGLKTIIYNYGKLKGGCRKCCGKYYGKPCIS